MLTANAEYKEALAQAGEFSRPGPKVLCNFLPPLAAVWARLTSTEALLKELKAVLHVTLGDGTDHNIVANLGKLGLAA